jgi:hypothetical protein
MLTKTVQKNKHGGHTWNFKLDSLHHVFLPETDNGSFVVEFKEWKFISYKTHFSFVSQNRLKLAISETLDRFFEFLKTKEKYNFTVHSKQRKLDELLTHIDTYNLDD